MTSNKHIIVQYRESQSTMIESWPMNRGTGTVGLGLEQVVCRTGEQVSVATAEFVVGDRRLRRSPGIR